MQSRADNLSSVREVYYALSRRYPPLSIDAERKLVQSHKGGEADLRRLLFYHNIRGALALATRYKSRVSSEDDGIQKAVLGLYNASQKFDLTKGVRFLTYAAWWVVKELTDDLRRMDGKMDLVCVSLDTPIKGANKDETGDATLLDFVHNMMKAEYQVEMEANYSASVSPADTVEIEEQTSDISRLVSSILKTLPHITERDKSIYMDYYDLSEMAERHEDAEDRDKTGQKCLRVVAARHGVAHQWVSEIVKRINTSIRRELTAHYDYDSEIRIRTRRIEKARTVLAEENRKPEYLQNTESIESEIKFEEDMIASAAEERALRRLREQTNNERRRFEKAQTRRLNAEQNRHGQEDRNEERGQGRDRGRGSGFMSVTQNWDNISLMFDSRKSKKKRKRKYDFTEWRPAVRWAYLIGLNRRNRESCLKDMADELRTESKRLAILRRDKDLNQSVFLSGGQTEVSAGTDGRTNMTPNQLLLASHEDEFETPHENVREMIELSDSGYTRMGQDEIED